MKKHETGICQLTLARGRFVKSHIVPKALTPKDIPGGPMVQSDGRDRPKKRFDSWYDKRLVVRKGEDILAEIDDRAIKEIRRLKLAWKYWEDASELNMKPFKAGAAIGVRTLDEVNHATLARFAISIIWRAGASQMKDLQGFQVSETLVEQARQVVIGTREFDPLVFPIKVFQFGTKGPLHNLTPMNHELRMPDGSVEKFFRIFVNGLFFHVMDIESCQPSGMGEATWYLRTSGPLNVVCLDFEESAQNEFVTAVFDHASLQQQRRTLKTASGT